MARAAQARGGAFDGDGDLGPGVGSGVGVGGGGGGSSPGRGHDKPLSPCGRGVGERGEGRCLGPHPPLPQPLPREGGGEQDPGSGLTRLQVSRRRRLRRGRLFRHLRLEVRRKHQRHPLAAPSQAACPGLSRDIAGLGRAVDAPHPARDRPRQRLDVRGERRVEGQVPARVVADDVDHRRARPARVVQVGDAVGQAGAQVQQCGGRTAGHAAPAVGRAGADVLLQPEHAADARLPLERAHEVELGRARVGEAHLQALGVQGVQQKVGAGAHG